MSRPGWSLVVVKGREPGRAFALAEGATVLGHAPGESRAVDLSGQEVEGARRMSARQAAVECGDASASVRDLDSDSGTFVNRRRVLPGLATPLREGDIVQLGSIQLRVARGGVGPPPPAQPEAAGGPLPAPFRLAGGATCRTWDDFLTISAQRWGGLRDELTSGRLAGHLNAHGRGASAPSPDAPGTPDERLDAWLAALPTPKARAAAPELDVFPASITVRVAPGGGGGTTRRTIRVANAGYRLLRARIRVAAADADCLAPAGGFAGREFFAAEAVDVPVDVTLPAALDGARRASLVVEGNGGTARVEFVIEPAPAASGDGPPAGAGDGVAGATALPDLGRFVARHPARTRFAAAAVALGLLRLAISGADAAWPDPAPASPGLRGPAAGLAVVGALAGAAFALRRGEPRAIPSCAAAAAAAGVLASALLVAACRGIEPGFGPNPGRWVAPLIWAALGAALAAVSARLAPHRPSKEAVP